MSTESAVATCAWCDQAVSLLRDRPAQIRIPLFDQVQYLHNRCAAVVMQAVVEAKARKAVLVAPAPPVLSLVRGAS